MGIRIMNIIKYVISRLFEPYKVGQVWEDVFHGKVTITEVTQSTLTLEAKGYRTFITKGFAKLCLKKLIST